ERGSSVMTIFAVANACTYSVRNPYDSVPGFATTRSATSFCNMNTARRQCGSAITRRRIGVPTLYGRLPTARNVDDGSSASTASSLRNSMRSPKRDCNRANKSGSISIAIKRFGSSISFSVSTPSPVPISSTTSSGCASIVVTILSTAPRLRRKFWPHFFLGFIRFVILRREDGSEAVKNLRHPESAKRDEGSQNTKILQFRDPSPSARLRMTGFFTAAQDDGLRIDSSQ